MLIFLYLLFMYYVVPQLAAYASAMVEPVMVIVIMLAGIVMVFGAIGVRISNNLGSTVVNGIFQAIGYVVRQIFRGIAWIVRTIVNAIPGIFRGMRNWLSSLGLNAAMSNTFAVILTVLVVIIII